ncbi:CsbD family protein [Methylobacterium oryzihabitans]|uniref:CsbD family protein n=1 Tax=Methylobacterium oryzihabitans TaxID=2499852 RepID=A0A3S3U343_9HYPH|nr:CsbD family protein [Methylobacterium oryzihabitans]RVU14388.1 CsbD family protein [Methylobacterium oryzihabitans]
MTDPKRSTSKRSTSKRSTSRGSTSTGTEQLKGSVKEAIGKLTGDARVEAEGRRQKHGTRPREAGPRED